MLINRLNQYRDRENGFTLIELLIVVLIIGVLAAIAIPVYLGLQNQAKNNSAKQDTHSAVTSIQVALTEGQDLNTALTNNSDTANRSDGNQVVATAALDGSKNYTVVGTQKDTQFTYTYDSKTGRFTEGTAAINLGGGAPSSPPAAAVITANGEAGNPTNANWKSVAGATAAPTNTVANSGTYSIPSPLCSSANCGSATYVLRYYPGTALTANKTYTYVYYLYTAATGKTMVPDFTGISNSQPNVPLTANTWTKVTGTFTTQAGYDGSANNYIYFHYTNADSTNIFYIDDLTITAQ